MSTPPKVSICLATYRRPEQLIRLLRDLSVQTLLPDELIVVDNDAEGSAWGIVESARARLPFPVHYEVQPQKNISLTRNRTVALASGEWLAFIDDDERAPALWLQQLMDAQRTYMADGVLGPVVPLLPLTAADWIRRGSFYDWPRASTGAVVAHNRLRFGNVLLRASLLRAMEMPFDPQFGSTGGEDGDLLVRLARNGASIIWCDEAVVHEPVETARLSLRWLLKRSLRGGQDYARHSLRGLYRHAGFASGSLLFARALAQTAAAAVLALLLLPLGRHRSVHWLMKAAANAGKLSAFWGWHYHEYA